MGKSQRLRASQLRGIERLLGECQELWYDTAAWRTRMFAGLCELTGAQCALGGELAGGRKGPAWTPLQEPTTWGMTPTALECFGRFMARGDPAIDVPTERLRRTLRDAKGRVITADQRQLVKSREWQYSEIYNEYFRPSELEHRLVSYQELPCAARAVGGSVHQGVTLYRLRGEKPFGERELRIVQHFDERCGRLIGSALSSVAADPLAELPPRVGQTLMRLLEGRSEKQAAARMGISRHTVDDYVKHLHRHFGVSRRRELLVRCRALSARLQPASDGADRAAFETIVAMLPPRAQETLTLLLRGAGEPDIARQMHISPHTVRDYVKRLYLEFNVSSRAELFARCQAHGQPPALKPNQAG